MRMRCPWPLITVNHIVLQGDIVTIVITFQQFAVLRVTMQLSLALIYRQSLYEQRRYFCYYLQHIPAAIFK